MSFSVNLFINMKSSTDKKPAVLLYADSTHTHTHTHTLTHSHTRHWPTPAKMENEFTSPVSKTNKNINEF